MPIRVSVVYSSKARHTFEEWVALGEGASVLQAVQMSGVLRRFPEIDLARVEVGIWGRKASLDQLLRERDRIEIYRPLAVDPKVARRERFRKQGARAAGLFAKKRPGTTSGE